MKYSIAKNHAKDFANNMKETVYIAKANKINDYYISFNGTASKNNGYQPQGMIADVEEV